jgi:hypothetical protein
MDMSLSDREHAEGFRCVSARGDGSVPDREHAGGFRDVLDEPVGPVPDPEHVERPADSHLSTRGPTIKP